MVCDRCKQPNTEMSSFNVDIDLSKVKNRMSFSGSSWIKRVVMRYVNALLNTELTAAINVCQTCQSRMFRKLDKDK